MGRLHGCSSATPRYVDRAWRKWLPLHGETVERLPYESDIAFRDRQQEAWGLAKVNPGRPASAPVVAPVNQPPLHPKRLAGGEIGAAWGAVCKSPGSYCRATLVALLALIEVIGAEQYSGKIGAQVAAGQAPHR